MFNALDRLMLRRLARAADRAQGVVDRQPAPALRALHKDLRRTGEQLDQLDRSTTRALDRLQAPLPRPDAHSDWIWRHDIWHAALPDRIGGASGVEIADGIKLFHDCPMQEVMLRQCRATAQPPAPPYALALEVYGFAGSFLSLAVDLPETAAQRLRLRHVIGARITLTLERPVEVFARLNIRHGPNTEHAVREISHQGGGRHNADIGFDLAYTSMNEKRVEALWLDLIFEAPAMNRIVIEDLTLYRHLRADI